MHFLFDHNSDLRLAIYKLLKMGLMGHFTTFWIDWIDWIDTMGSLPNRWKPALCKPRSSWKVTSHQSGVKRWRGCFPGLVIGPTHPNLSTLCQRTNLWVKKWSPFRLKFGLVIFCAKNHGAFRVPSFTCFPIFVPSIPDLVCWCLHSPLRCFLLMSLSTGWMLFDIVLVSFYSYSHAQKLLENASLTWIRSTWRISMIWKFAGGRSMSFPVVQRCNVQSILCHPYHGPCHGDWKTAGFCWAGPFL